jgi:spore coat protein CotF
MNNNNNSNMVSNPETEVPKTSEMNDSDYLNEILSAEKNMSNNYATVMSEASNDQFYQTLSQIFKETKDSGRTLFSLLFQKGWYRLEKAEQTKIDSVSQEYQQKLNELK